MVLLALAGMCVLAPGKFRGIPRHSEAFRGSPTDAECLTGLSTAQPCGDTQTLSRQELLLQHETSPRVTHDQARLRASRGQFRGIPRHSEAPRQRARLKLLISLVWNHLEHKLFQKAKNCPTTTHRKSLPTAQETKKARQGER